MEMWKWLGQQSKDFYAPGFNALVKRWDKCIHVAGGYVKKYMFFPGSNITCFTFYIHLWPVYWLSFIKSCHWYLLRICYWIKIQDETNYSQILIKAYSLFKSYTHL
jgi:hypothetical protein